MQMIFGIELCAQADPETCREVVFKNEDTKDKTLRSDCKYRPPSRFAAPEFHRARTAAAARQRWGTQQGDAAWNQAQES
jgi:hypothetical protein